MYFRTGGIAACHCNQNKQTQLCFFFCPAILIGPCGPSRYLISWFIRHAAQLLPIGKFFCYHPFQRIFYRTLKLFHAIHCSAQYHWIAWYNSTIFYHLYTSRAIWWTLRISAELIIIQQRTFIWAPIEMCIPFNIKDFIQKTRLLKTKSTVFSGHQVSDCHGLYFIKFWDFRFNWVLVFNCFYRFLGFPEGVVVKVLAGWVCGQWLGMAGLQSKRH